MNSSRPSPIVLADPGKAVSAEEAVGLIRKGVTVATSGFVAIGFAEEIAVALEERFLGLAGALSATVAPGSDGHVSYFERIARGPSYALADAVRDEVG